MNTAGLAPGTYRGTISYSLSSAAVQNVNVTLVIPVPLRSPSTFETNATVACSGNALVVTHTSLADNFTRHAGTPTPISAIVTDNCGNPVKNASVAASFSDGDTPVILNAQSTGSTTYWGLWTPQTVAAPVSVTISASAPSWSLTAVPVLGQITAGTLPLISNAGALHVFNPRTGAALSPGGIAQIYGTNFSSSAQAAATIPLPGSLAGTTVTIGGLTAPLFYVSPGQINAQVPFELAAGKTYQITVANAQGTSSAVSLPLIAAAPGIAAYASGALIAQHTDGSLVSAGSPAKSGEVVVLYLAGLGLTSDPGPSGTASPGNPLQSPQTPAVLLLNGKPVPTLFTGLTPGLVGLYQVNFQVPQGTPDGNLQVQLMQGREASNAGYIPVKSAQ